MKLGIQPDVEHRVRGAFEFASQNGFSHVEILMDHPLFCREHLDYSEILELKGCYDLDVLIHAPCASTNFLSTSSAMRRMSYEEMEKTVYFGERCEAEVVTFHLGWNPGFITARGFVYKPELFQEHNVKVIENEMYPFLKTYGSLLSLENTIGMDDALIRGIEFLIQNTELNLTFDIGHYNIKEGQQIFLDNFDRVVNVHLHDNDGKTDTHSSLGEGCVDLDLIPKSYHGFFTLEVRDEKAILESKKYLNSRGL
ncbi:MAG: sugar phosphate isomerase/epimerase family protein [Halobacteriota archaeon]